MVALESKGRDIMKFKIGDRVKAIGEVGNKKVIGAIGTIVDVEISLCGVNFDENIDGHKLDDNEKCKKFHGWWVETQHLTPLVEKEGEADNDAEEVILETKSGVKDKTTIKDLLKVGQVVEISCHGSKRMGVVVVGGERIQTSYGYHEISDYDDNLLDSSRFVDKIYDSTIDKIYENTDEGLKLIWDRDDYVDWSKVEVDTKIQVSYCGDVWINRYFARYENGLVYAFGDGGDSFTTKEDDVTDWEFTRLYKEEK